MNKKIIQTVSFLILPFLFIGYFIYAFIEYTPDVFKRDNIIWFIGIILSVIVVGLVILMHKKNRKYKKLMTTCNIIIFLFFLGLQLDSHSSCIKYNNWWVIGRHYTEVVERYGEFDNPWNAKAYYIGMDDSWIMPSHLPQYYWLECDENGIVTDAYVAGPKGG